MNLLRNGRAMTVWGDLCFFCTNGLARDESFGQGRAQSVVHLSKRVHGLVEEAKDNLLAKLSIVLVVVHFENLTESGGIDAIAALGQAGYRFALTE